MRNYTWLYGIFHWFVHYSMTILIVLYSGIVVIPFFIPVDFFGATFSINIIDIILACTLATIIDLDHLPVLKKFGFNKVVFAQKRLVSPLHNFFFLSFTSILSAFMAIFISKEIGVLVFVLIVHLLWDIFEDVFIFRTGFRRWEKTWGLNKEDMEKTYNELLQIEASRPPPEPRMKKISRKLRERSNRLKERGGRISKRFSRKPWKV